ncbi:MAG: hypothetical protein QGH60_11775, partial [Phycisphaerae bacterium]|nr:hypothetical protein [Phycisphaerae bacterium]
TLVLVRTTEYQKTVKDALSSYLQHELAIGDGLTIRSFPENRIGSKTEGESRCNKANAGANRTPDIT